MRRNDLADVAWGPGFFVGALYCASEATPLSLSKGLVLFLVLVWAVRLSLYIHFRNHGKSEDFRYKAWREQWGNWFYVRSFLQVFMLQGILLSLIGIPVWLCLLQPSSQEPFSQELLWLGAAIWAFGLAFEAIADSQMAKFRKEKTRSGLVMRSGLWKYSRHPNYFGESVLWWGIYLTSLGCGSPAWSAIGPVILTFLLVRVSGVPMLEKKYADNPDYQNYRATTPSFIPWFPRR